MRREPTRHARLVVKMIEFAGRCGASPDALLDAGGLGAEQLSGDDARVPLDGVYRVVEAAVAMTGDEYFGLHFAATIELEDLDSLGFLVSTSSTFGEALENCARYQDVAAEGERITAADQGDWVHLTYTGYGQPRPAHRHMAEFVFYDFVVNGSRWIGQPIAVRDVRFRAPRPGDVAPYEVFGAAVQFGAPSDELVFPASVMELRMPNADRGLCGFFERYIQKQLAELPATVSLRARARSVIEDYLDRGGPDLETLAGHLGMRGRTLQRRLQDEGCTVQTLVEEVRRSQALVLLDSPLPIAEIARRLGYSEASAFHRAFRRWAGCTPGAYRARLAATDG